MSESKTTMATLAEADWDQLEIDVTTRIRVLARTARAMAKPPHNAELADKIANDLIMPNVGMLAAFCQAIDLDDADLVRG